MRAKDKFGSLLGIGLTAQIGIQVVINIMVVTDLLPNTGISLPFFSYGGSSLIMLFSTDGNSSLYLKNCQYRKRLEAFKLCF